MAKKDVVVFRPSRAQYALFTLLIIVAALMILPVDTIYGAVVTGLICVGIMVGLFLAYGQTIMIVSKDGITVYNHYSLKPENRKQFISWSNFKRAKIIGERQATHIWIFTTSNKEFNSSARINLSKEVLARNPKQENTPAAIFPLIFSGYSAKEVFTTINKYHSLYYGNPPLVDHKLMSQECEEVIYRDEKFIID